MPEKVKKPAKPTTNLLQNIRSPRPSQIDENHYFEAIDVFDDYDIDFDVIRNF